ncbi:MAG: hypothetical protein JRI97_10680 [Deltaproteobacteria bacterium]|nr:hypothetical protein [Deltaproteobacteria bacterium]
MDFFLDEALIIGPASDTLEIQGLYNAYPAFPSQVYGALLRAAGLVKELDLQEILVVSRVFNVFLFLFNLLLFYLVVRRWLERWSLLALFLFASTPSVFYSATVIKAEALLMAETLGLLLLVPGIVRFPYRWMRHLAAGVLCGLALGTKYYPAPLAVYAAALFLAFWKSRPLPQRALWAAPRILLFVAAVGAAAYLTDFHFPDVEYLQKNYDIRVLDEPSFFRSVDAPGAFPYGRVSYMLLFQAPFALGWMNILPALAAVALRRVPWPAVVVGGALTLAVLGIGALTLTHFPWDFVLIAPLVAFSVTCLLKKFSLTNRLSCFVFAVFMVAVVLASILQYSSVVAMIRGCLVEERRLHREAVNLVGKDYMYFLISKSLLVQNIKSDCIEETVRKKQPHGLLILDSYVYNLCKYPEGSGYRKSGEFLMDVIEGKTEYRLVQQQRIPYFRLNLTVDPERSMSFYLLAKKPVAEDAAAARDG